MGYGLETPKFARRDAASYCPIHERNISHRIMHRTRRSSVLRDNVCVVSISECTLSVNFALIPSAGGST
ncbi:hypothetical protein Plhal304r1_c004g0016001 [Plasmopara halstedii]